MENEKLNKLVEIGSFQHKSPLERLQALESENVIIEILENASRDPFKEIRLAAVSNKNMTSDLLRLFAMDTSFEVRLACFGHPNCPSDCFSKLLNEKYELVKLTGVKNPKCPPEVLRRFALTDHSKMVKRAVASNPNCPADTLEFLTTYDAEVSWGILLNLNAEERVIGLLALGKGELIKEKDEIFWKSEPSYKAARDYALRDIRCPYEIIDFIARRELDEDLKKTAEWKMLERQIFGVDGKDENSILESQVQSCHAVSPEEAKEEEKYLSIITNTIKGKFNDYDSMNAGASTKSLSTLKLAFKHWNDRVRIGATSNALATPEMLSKALEDTNDDVRMYAANHENMPEYLLEEALLDPKNTVNAAWSKKASAAVLRTAAGMEDFVLHFVLRNRNCPWDVIYNASVVSRN